MMKLLLGLGCWLLIMLVHEFGHFLIAKYGTRTYRSFEFVRIKKIPLGWGINTTEQETLLGYLCILIGGILAGIIPLPLIIMLGIPWKIMLGIYLLGGCGWDLVSWVEILYQGIRRGFRIKLVEVT